MKNIFLFYNSVQAIYSVLHFLAYPSQEVDAAVSGVYESSLPYHQNQALWMRKHSGIKLNFSLCGSKILSRKKSLSLQICD